MSEPKWTEGPWDYRPREYDDWGWIRGGPDSMTVGHAHSPLDDDDANRHRAAKTDPWEKNARLMAAAPELYEALARIVETNAALPSFPGEIIEAAHRAMRKARGEP